MSESGTRERAHSILCVYAKVAVKARPEHKETLKRARKQGLRTDPEELTALPLVVELENNVWAELA
jgi:hypothetical protein